MVTETADVTGVTHFEKQSDHCSAEAQYYAMTLLAKRRWYECSRPTKLLLSYH